MIVNATAFATASSGTGPGVLAAFDCPVLQVALAGSSRAAWEASPRGLSPRDLAMHVVLPEVDGRIFANAIAFKERVADRRRLRADGRAAGGRSGRRRRRPRRRLGERCGARRVPERRVAIVLANYPNRDGRLANGVGLDTPESLAAHHRGAAPATATTSATRRDDARDVDAARCRPGPTNALAGRERRSRAASPGRSTPTSARSPRCLPASRRAVTARWGAPERRSACRATARFRLGIHRFGSLVVGVQPARGYNIDPKSTYHDPDLVPPHHYLAFYLCLRGVFEATP